ncbi:PEP-CTERM sorting domain-containing protein [Nostoc sp. FACHB-888]|nr:PEP-CTERM sorting domain-containing protein [Nostoc sp. FACHB-888]
MYHEKSLYDANVDLINTDNLTGLSTYIQSRQTQAVPEPSLSIAFLAVLGTPLLLKRRRQSQSLIDLQS